MTTTNKEDGPYQVARTGLHGKLDTIVLQVDRGPKILPMHKQIMSATKQKNLAERSSNMGSQQLLGGPVLPRP